MQPFLHHPHVPKDAVCLVVEALPLGQIVLWPGHHRACVSQGEVVHPFHLHLAAVLDAVLERSDLPRCLVGYFAESAHPGLDAGHHQGVWVLLQWHEDSGNSDKGTSEKRTTSTQGIPFTSQKVP